MEHGGFTLAEVTSLVRETAVYPEQGHNLTYPVLGLCGEAGELANKYKKVQRDEKDPNIPTEERRREMIAELGDVLWYVGCTAIELGVPLDAVFLGLKMKLLARQREGTIHGSGDKR